MKTKANVVVPVVKQTVKKTCMQDRMCTAQTCTEVKKKSYDKQDEMVLYGVIHHWTITVNHNTIVVSHLWRYRCHSLGSTKSAATFQKLGVSIFPSCPYKRPTTAVKGVEGRGVGSGRLPPGRVGDLEERRS